MGLVSKIKVWYKLRKLSSVQNLFKSDTVEYLDLSEILTAEEKKAFVTKNVGAVARLMLIFFKTLGLKAYLDQMVVNAVTGEEYILMFRKLDKTKPNWNMGISVMTAPNHGQIEIMATEAGYDPIKNPEAWSAYCQGIVGCLDYYKLLPPKED